MFTRMPHTKESQGVVVVPRLHRNTGASSPLRRDVMWLLALKVTLITVIYLLLIRPAPRPAQDADATAEAVTGVSAATSQEVNR